MNDSSGHNDEKLSLWLQGQLSTADWEHYKETSGRRAALEQMEKIARHTADWSPSQPKRTAPEAWVALQSRIASSETPKSTVSIPENETKVRPMWRSPWLTGIAASVLLVVGLWYFLGNAPEEIYNPQGTTMSHVLPDNSSIVLNADSKITYEPRGFKGERLVKLEGEAFFEVQKGATFVVQSDYGQVTVLGTSFNIYSREDKFEVACASGKVQVTVRDQEPVILTAGMVTTLDQGDLQVDTTVDENHILDWQRGEFYFRNAPLSQVVDALQRQLDVHIVTHSSLDGMIYTGFFSSKDTQAALQSVLEPMGLKYQIKGDTVLIE